ncbi:sensor histidine kinase [Rubrivirga litoralis]|uniref:histidine kinase n=1 Tax=Rubrivirga litoralis TaxID=3075598 RepID=A0ABU3BRM4_9BACT|nr:ATP-binding protein [Rubrivirga sp. F394]MDT0631928.1 histidine kinase [Rubrivirga sp. F394]
MAARTSTAPRSDAQAALDAVLLRAERTRSGLVGAFFGVLTVALAVRIGVGALAGRLAEPGAAGLGAAVAVVTFLAVMTAIEWAIRRDAESRLRDGRAPSDLAAYGVVVVEVGAFALGAGLVTRGGDGVVVVLMALVGLSSFRMVPGATALAGAAAGAAYLALAWGRPAPSAESVVWTAALFPSVGVAFALLARAVRRAAVRLAVGVAERQRLEADLLASVEATQALVGRELHDGVGSHLTGLALYARGLVRRLERGEPVEVAEMADAAGMADDAVGQVRRLSRGLTLSVMEPGELASALADLARTATKASGVTVTFRADADLAPLAAQAERHLYRIAQEAVTNALRHAAPGRVEVDLSVEGAAVVLSVEDDGAGLVDGARREGAGLRTMAHRARLAGGAFEVGPGIERGTAVRAVVPAGGDGPLREAGGHGSPRGGG